VELLARVYDDLLERFEANRTPVPRPQKRPR
jgi:hypothetical protein